jgi:hypothetical protein
MRTSPTGISKLCESWWTQVTDATKIEHQRYVQSLLALLDWDQPIPYTPQAGAAALSVSPFLLRAGGQTAVTAFFVLPGTLEPPTATIERGLDYCPATRILVDDARQINVNYALISDLNRSYLYDARTDELLLHADDPKTFESDFVPVLRKTQMERGALEELRRQPRSVVARRLREWLAHWQENLCAQLSVTETQAHMVLDRLLVVRFLFDHEILRRTKWRLQQRFHDLEISAATGGADCGEGLVKLFHDMWFDWKIELFRADPSLDTALSQSPVVAALLSEFALLSRSKFNIATILESFNYGDPTEKMRVRTVPDENEEREIYLAKHSLDTIDTAQIQVELKEEGYRAIFYWFDKVVRLYDRLGLEFDCQTQQETHAVEDLDLFAWSELNANRPDACADSIAYACEHGFGVYYESPRQYRVARLLLTLHLISRYHENRQAINAFPSLEDVFMQHPTTLPAERALRGLPRQGI